MNTLASPSIRFGHVEVFPARRQIFVAGQVAPLGARAFDLLLVLIDNAWAVLIDGGLVQKLPPGPITGP